MRRRRGSVPEEGPDVQLRRLRRRARAARAEAVELREQLSRTREELSRTRASLADPYPDLALPDRVSATVDHVVANRLTYLHPRQLSSLASVVHEAEVAGRPGLLVEAGTARGGSAIVMAAAKSPERPLHVYDVFGMIPAPGEGDGDDVHGRYREIAEGRAHGPGGEEYYGYREDLLGEVTASFAAAGLPVEDHRVRLVPGLFADTIDLAEPVAVAHLDGDWYESTMTCLERLAPLLVPGGRIVLDDYHTWSGCRRAVDEYFADRPGFRTEYREKVHVVRLAPESPEARG